MAKRQERTLSQKIARRQKIAKRMRIVFFAGGAVVAVFTLVSTMVFAPINDVTTGETREYPDIVPIAWSLPADELMEETIDVLEAAPKFEISQTQPQLRRVIVDKKSIFFTDEMTITLRPRGPRETVVHVRSRSHVGKGDFGANARHIRTFFELMEAELGEGTPQPSQIR